MRRTCKNALLILAVSLVGCDTESVSTPSRVELSPEPVIVTAPVVHAVEASSCDALRDGVLVVRNDTSQAQTYHGFSTDVDQGLIGTPEKVVKRPGETFRYQGAVRCSQVDVSHHPWPDYDNVICAAWYGVDGKPKDDPRQVNWAACAPALVPTPRPTPPIECPWCP